MRFHVKAATERRKHTQVDFVWITRSFRTIAAVSDQLGALGRQRIRPCYQRQNAGVEYALLEQLTLFPNASIVLEDVDTHRSNFRRRVKAQTKRRQSHVNAGTVPESENMAGLLHGREYAGIQAPRNPQNADLYGVPFSHLFTELQISAIEVQISPIQLQISPIQLEISSIQL